MKIFSIDPGTTESAYLILETSPFQIIEFGKIQNLDIYLKIHQSKWDIFAIEGIVSYGMPMGNDTIQTVFWIGKFVRFIEESMFCYQKIYIVSRQEIKMCHCKRTSKVNDGNIRQALIDKYGKQGVKKAQGPTYGLAQDTWSALAIGTYIMEYLNENKSIKQLYQN